MRWRCEQFHTNNDLVGRGTPHVDVKTDLEHTRIKPRSNITAKTLLGRAVLLGAFILSCTPLTGDERGDGAAAHSSDVRVRFQMQSGSIVREAAISAFYFREGTAVPRVLAARAVSVTPGAATTSLQVPLADCLADSARERILSDACPLRISVALRDSAGMLLDSSATSTISARVGEVLNAPLILLSVPARIDVTLPDTMLIGSVVTLEAVVRDSAGTVLPGRTVTWTSSAPAIASVSGTGILTAIALGSTSIEGRSLSASTIQSIVVAPNPPALIGLIVSPPSTALEVGSTQLLSSTPSTGGGNITVSIAYGSSNPAVASVSQTGLVTAIAPGSATITVTATGSGAGFTNSQLTAIVPVTVTIPPPLVVSTVLPPGGSAVTTLGPSEREAGYIVELNPQALAQGTFDGACIATSNVLPQWNGTSWRDALTIRSCGQPTLPVEARLHSTAGLPLAGTFTLTLPPGVLVGTILGQAEQDRGYVVKLTPLDSVPAAFDSVFVQPEWNGTQWIDVLRTITSPTSPALRVLVRVYHVTTQPVVTTFTTTLQPGVQSVTLVSPSSLAGAYVVDVTPLSSLPFGLSLNRIQTEWNGFAWREVYRLQSRPEDPPVQVRVRIWRIGN